MAAADNLKDRIKFWTFYAGFFFLFLVSGIRMYKAFTGNIGIDFTLFFSCAHAAVRGQDFFDVHNLVFYHWEESLMVLPGLLLFFIPYLLFDIHFARLIYFLLGWGVAGFAYVRLFVIVGLLRKVNFRRPGKEALLFFGGAFLFLNSSPLLMCQRNGQMTVWVLLLLVLFFSVRNRYWRAVFFGLAAVCKYSMLTFFAPLLLIKKQYLICFAAFAVFLLPGLWPALAGHNLFTLYARYAEVIMNTLNGGCNSFPLAGHDLLQFGFFRAEAVNLAGKLFFLLAMLLIFKKEYGRPGIGLNLLLLVFCLTMLVSYHRLYDNVIVVLLLIIKTNFLINRKSRCRALVCGLFLAYYLVPVSWIFTIANYLGTNISWLQKEFFISPYSQYAQVLPLIAFSQTALGLWALYLYLKTEEDYIFELEPSAGNDIASKRV
ncbi:MAG: hypothetical protein PHV59_02860 [Victivallales bacterium]|nr:hypothetical protein [Victivallales bacterium]